MLYLLATLALILRANAMIPEEECLECCHVHMAVDENGEALDFPYVLLTEDMFIHLNALWSEEDVPESEYWVQKAAEAWFLFENDGLDQAIIHVDGTQTPVSPMPLPVGSKWILGKVAMPAPVKKVIIEDEPETIWSNAAAECIEKDGEYIWSTSIGDVYVALFERDNAECAYVNGEDVYECDGPVEPITPPVEPATTSDSIEIEDPEPAVTTIPDPTLTPVDDTTSLSDLGDDNSGVDTNADIDNNQAVQQLQDASASPAASRQSVPTWVIPTAVGGVLVLTLSYIMYIYKQKLVPSALPDIEAPRDAAPQDIEIHVEEPSGIDVEAPSDIESQDVQTVTQEA